MQDGLPHIEGLSIKVDTDSVGRALITVGGWPIMSKPRLTATERDVFARVAVWLSIAGIQVAGWSAPPEFNLALAVVYGIAR